jgi:hypothetical protein
MAKTKKLYELPDFPKNRLGLKRGTILLATNSAINEIAIMVGQRIFLGFDGEFVRCGPFTWSIEKIVEEIEQGTWLISEEYIELSDPKESKDFALFVEHIQLIPIKLDA